MANELNERVRVYSRPSTVRAVWQIVNTVLPYFALIVMMYFMIQYRVPYILIILFSIIPALFMVRIFIMFHDCTHQSFIKSKKTMPVLGHLFGILTFTPFYKWQRDHIIHHRTVGNLDKRGTGDVWMITVAEYQASPWVKRLMYRIYRFPLVLFIVSPILLFLIGQRFPTTNTKKVWFSTLLTNLGIAFIVLTVAFTVGIRYYLLIQIPIIFFASIAGVWLFYVQHQYEDVYWEHTYHWKFQDAALQGASVYRLPIILEWFTGSIGYHNVHHLNPRIPNYNLRRTYKNVEILQKSYIVTFIRSFKLAMLCFYDETNQIMISYRQYRKLVKSGHA